MIKLERVSCQDSLNTDFKEFFYCKFGLHEIVHTKYSGFSLIFIFGKDNSLLDNSRRQIINLKNMGDFDDIKQKEEIILKLSMEMENSSGERNRKNILAKIKQSEFDQETLIMNYLEKNDEEYIKLFNENFDLLVNDNIDLVVTTEGASPFVSYARELYGEIHSNGFLYFTTKKINIIHIPFQSNYYPLSYMGLINYFGESNAFALKKKFKLFGSRVPQRYKGSIDEDGNVNFETTETYFEWDGHDYVKSIMADPFSGNAGKRAKFIENRTALKNQIKIFRKKV